MKKLIIILAAVLLSEMQTKAYNFELNGIYYNFIEGTADEVEVTYFIDYRHDDFDGEGDYYGDIIIPETIIHENKTYRVTRIGEQAFRESGVQTITIPKSIKFIGMKALDCFPKRIEVQWETPLDLREVEKMYPIVYDFSGHYTAEDIFNFDEIRFERVTLVVPKNTKALYQEQEVWKNFIHIEEKHKSTVDVRIAIIRFLSEYCRYKDVNPTHQEGADELNYFLRVFNHNWEYIDPDAVRPRLIDQALRYFYDHSIGVYEDASDVARMTIRRSMCYIALAFLSGEDRYPIFLADARENLNKIAADINSNMWLIVNMLELYQELSSEYVAQKRIEQQISVYHDDLKNREKYISDTNFIADYRDILVSVANVIK
jgi:hypothetical protein